MLRFIDGFAHYSFSQIGRKWTSINLANADLSLGTGRFTSSKCITKGTINNSSISRTIDNQATWIIGFAFNYTGTGNIFLRLYDSSTVQLTLNVNSDNTLSIYRGNNATLLGTTTATIPNNAWVYIELKTVINNTTGSVVLKINGTTALNLTGINTRSSTNNTANVITFFDSVNNNGAKCSIADLYICDGQGTTNNDFLGDCRVETLFPNGAGSHTDFTIGGSAPAATNWQGAAESPADDDVTYNYSSTLNQMDTYAFANLSSTPVNIFGIQHNLTVRKDNSGARAETPVIRISTTDYLLSAYTLTTSYLINSQIVETSPATSSAWTASEINNAEFGLKLTA
jgi:hypothetical protein